MRSETSTILVMWFRSGRVKIYWSASDFMNIFSISNGCYHEIKRLRNSENNYYRIKHEYNRKGHCFAPDFPETLPKSHDPGRRCLFSNYYPSCSSFGHSYAPFSGNCCYEKQTAYINYLTIRWKTFTSLSADVFLCNNKSSENRSILRLQDSFAELNCNVRCLKSTRAYFSISLNGFLLLTPPKCALILTPTRNKIYHGWW